MRGAVINLARAMEARFREFDGKKGMGAEDNAPNLLSKAIIKLYEAMTMGAALGDSLKHMTDAANYIALASHVEQHGITDCGVNDTTYTEPVFEEHYGQGVWVSPLIESIRHEECLCYHCKRMNPGEEDHCRTAALLYAVCRSTGIAAPVTRCPDWLDPND